jgi:hypothetical protein
MYSGQCAVHGDRKSCFVEFSRVFDRFRVAGKCCAPRNALHSPPAFNNTIAELWAALGITEMQNATSQWLKTRLGNGVEKKIPVKK